MARKPKRKYPSFFKVLIGDFVNKLRIPPAFVKNFRGNVPSNFTLESLSGRSWRVTVQDEEGDYFFCDGWSSFAKDHCLEHGDFLLFFFLGSSKFDVSVYGRTACEKNTILATKRRRGRPPINRRNPETPSKSYASCSKKASAASDHGRRITRSQKVEFVSEVSPTRPLFQMVLKEYQKYTVAVPSCFVKETGLAGKRRTVIKDPEGRMWPLNTIVDPKSRVFLGAGWAKFLQENQIGVGDTLLFEHIPNTGNSIHVKIIRKARRWK